MRATISYTGEEEIRMNAPCLSLSGRQEWKREESSYWGYVAAEEIAAYVEVGVRGRTAQT